MQLSFSMQHLQCHMDKENLREWDEFCLWRDRCFKHNDPLPNMTTQINYFQLVEKKVRTQNDLDSSIALISLAGSNYFACLRKKGSKKGAIKQLLDNEIELSSLLGLPCFAWKLINQLTLNLKSIHDLGVRKIGVVAIEPLGCLPRFTVASSVQRCNRNLDLAAKSHNLRLHRAVHKLRKENNGSVKLIVTMLCGGGERDTCSSIDEKGRRSTEYASTPNSTFFWDIFHPFTAWLLFSLLYGTISSPQTPLENWSQLKRLSKIGTIDLDYNFW
ncbi:hypothetical protein HYC85_000375 [Camellia sinensis]|uniref:GDSL esterase/lipase n=1 Tax=Camellia sinensis TaxID=4442 RepID=A0A7J7I3W9_CAMSI|nr:hypothetical protein HYC85_000375 [Camellia sinensis]